MDIENIGLSLAGRIRQTAGKDVDSLHLEDLVKLKASFQEDNSLSKNYKFEAVSGEERAAAGVAVFIASGRDLGVIFCAAGSEPSAEIAASKKIVKKDTFNAHIDFFIYEDLYEKLYEALRGQERSAAAIAAFVPFEIADRVLEAAAAGSGNISELIGTPFVFEGSSVVSIDLSGFTAMTDRLTEVLSKEKDPAKQAEAKKFVIEITNEIFADIANVIDKFTASIIKFGGDARLVLLTGENSATRALEMAQEVQLILRYFGGILTDFFGRSGAIDAGSIGNIRASIGISAGEAHLVVAEDGFGTRDVLPMGEVFYRAIEAQDFAKKGIALTGESLQKLSAEGRDGFFAVHPADRLPAERFTPEDATAMSEKKIFAVDCDRLNFLDYEVGDRARFTLEYIGEVAGFIAEARRGEKAGEAVAAEFERAKAELQNIIAAVTAGDISKPDELAKMKERVVSIRAAADGRLMEFMPAGGARESIAKKSMKELYRNYVADRISPIFHKFRTAAHRRAFYSKELIERARKELLSFIPRGFDEFIETAERINFQNARIMFVQVYGLKEAYDKSFAESGAERARELLQEFFAAANNLATPENGIIYLKSDPGAHYLKMIYLGGLRYISEVNPDTEMVRLSIRLHETAAAASAKHGAKISLKIGVNSGAIIIGPTGTTRREYTTISPEINLAARLGAYSAAGETIVSSRIYYASKDEVEYSERADLYGDGARGIRVKGIAAEIPVFTPKSIYPVKKRGKFMRHRELKQAVEWVDSYLSRLAEAPGPGNASTETSGAVTGKSESILVKTAELGLGAETLAYEIERYASTKGFEAFGCRGYDEHELMRNLLQDLCGIAAADTAEARLSKIKNTVAEYDPEMSQFVAALKTFFPFISFEKSQIVENFGGDELAAVLSNLVNRLFRARYERLKAESRRLLLRIFDIQNISEGSKYISPLVESLKDSDILSIFVSNGPCPLKDYVSDERTIVAGRMSQEQILEIFHFICEFKNKIALLIEIDRLDAAAIRKIAGDEALAKALNLPPDTLIASAPLPDLKTAMKKILIERIYKLSGNGRPLLTRHQARHLTGLFYRSGAPENQRGKFILEKIFEGGAAGEDIDAQFFTQYSKSHFQNERYKDVLTAALAIGEEFPSETLAGYFGGTDDVRQKINELVEIGMFDVRDRGVLAWDHYIYDVFRQKTDIDTLRRERLKLAEYIMNNAVPAQGETDEKASPLPEDPESLYMLSRLLFESLNLNVTPETMKKTLGIDERHLDLAAECAEKAAEKHEELYRHDLAAEELNRAVEILEYQLAQGILKDKEELAKVYFRLGEIYLTTGLFDQAEQLFNKAIDISDDDLLKVKVVFDGLTQVYNFLGDLDKLEKVCNKFFENYFSSTKKEFDHYKALYFNKIGIVNYFRGNYDEAKKYWLDFGLKFCQETNNCDVMGRILTNLGNLYNTIFDYGTASKYIEMSIINNGKINNKYSLSYDYKNLAINQILTGRPDLAIEAAKKSVQFASEIGYLILLIEPITYCGWALQIISQYDKAMEYHNEALRIFNLFISDPMQLVDILRCKAICNQKDHQKSVFYFKESLKTCAKIEDDQFRGQIVLECFCYYIEEYLRYSELIEARKAYNNAFLKFEINPELFDKYVGLRLRRNAIERISGEIALGLFTTNSDEDELFTALTKAFECFGKSVELKHKWGLAKSFLLCVKAANHIPPHPPGAKTRWDGFESALPGVISHLPEVEQICRTSGIPRDWLLLSEIYYELGSHLADDEMYGRAAECLAEFKKTGLEEDMTKILEEKLANFGLLG